MAHHHEIPSARCKKRPGFSTELALRPPQRFERISRFLPGRFSQRWIPKSQFWYPLVDLDLSTGYLNLGPGWCEGEVLGRRALVHFELRKEQDLVTSTGQKGYLRTSKTEFLGFLTPWSVAGSQFKKPLMFVVVLNWHLDDSFGYILCQL